MCVLIRLISIFHAGTQNRGYHAGKKSVLRGREAEDDFVTDAGSAFIRVSLGHSFKYTGSNPQRGPLALGLLFPLGERRAGVQPKLAQKRSDQVLLHDVRPTRSGQIIFCRPRNVRKLRLGLRHVIVVAQ
jgi:hypothetical protein